MGEVTRRKGGVQRVLHVQAPRIFVRQGHAFLSHEGKSVQVEERNLGGFAECPLDFYCATDTTTKKRAKTCAQEKALL